MISVLVKRGTFGNVKTKHFSKVTDNAKDWETIIKEGHSQNDGVGWTSILNSKKRKFRTQVRHLSKKGHGDNKKLKVTITGRTAFRNITAIYW